MAKKKARNSVQDSPTAATSTWKKWIAPAAMVLMLSAAANIFYTTYFSDTKSAPPTPAQPTPQLTDLSQAQPATTTADMGLGAEPLKMRVAQAVVATIELDFGGQVPSIADALQQIERLYQPDDGQGRTFAILDAYGEATPDGKLHISMHISSEKTGMGMLKFKRTGNLLWRARIGNPGEPPAGKKELSIYLSKGTGDGSNYVLDGKRGGGSVLDVFIQNSEQRVRDVWPNGAEREFTFVYSACGCPVKVLCVRAGDRTARTKEQPVIFPDDPAAVSMISGLMKW